MSSHALKITVCDRCIPGKEKPATEERVFSIDELYYRLDLCEPHAEMFDRDLSPWTRLAAEVDAPQAAKSTYFTEERRREAREIRDLRDRANRQAASKEFAARRAAEIEAEEALRLETRARQSIPGALKWRLTDHARQRMVEREFTIEEVLRTAAEPEHTYPQLERGNGNFIYHRGDCRLAVDALSRTVITVMDRSDTFDTPRTEPRKAVAR